ISRGDRIAQMIISRVCRARLTEVGALEETERGDGGFGHTGVR
ncbi:MAG: dUTP diphosphatase, partial [Deltaproteobacteria bacterium]|nr:dUTP diphosphatase [Deltaproteobacteria bacterium]